MADVVTELQTARPGFCNNITSADASLSIEVVPAVAGKSHYITSITISCISAITATVEVNPTGPPYIPIIGPIPFAATSAPYSITFANPVKTEQSEPILLDTSGAGDICLVIQGYTE